MSIELGSSPTGQEKPNNALLPNTPCSFCFPCLGSRRRSASAWWDRVRSTSWSRSRSQSEAARPTADGWWRRGLRALKKLREWSEIVAGPRWKTFIRRFNRNRSKRMGSTAKYQYDPLSYALNFDEGQNGDFQEDAYDGFRNFSTRYAAAVPVSAKAVSTEAGAGRDVAVLV